MAANLSWASTTGGASTPGLGLAQVRLHCDDRPPLRLQALDEIEAFDTDTLRVEAPLAACTAPLLRALVQWSLTRQDRQFGIVPPEAALAQQRRSDSARAAASLPFPVAVCGDHVEEVGLSGSRSVSQAEFLGRLAGEAPYFAVAVCGHGAEHCIALGADWLALHAHYGLKGPVLNARTPQAGVVLLGGCSTLRLADSVIPQHLQVAAALCANGAAVIGPYRNIRSAPRLHRAFVERMLAGLQAGHVAHELNLLLRDVEGEVPCIVLLGDPQRALGGADRPLQPQARFATDAAARASAVARLDIAGRRLRELRELISALLLWPWPLAHTQAAAHEIDDALRAVSMTLAVDAMDPLSSREIAHVEQAASRLCGRLLDGLAEDLVQWIRSGRWLQAAYAPVARRALRATRTCRAGLDCARGDGQVVDYAFDGPAMCGAMLARECDRCGSLAEWSAAAPAPQHLPVRVVEGSLRAQLPPLASDETGRLVIHRCEVVPTHDWPADGGAVEIDARASAVHGRVTLVACRIGPRGIATSYAHAFRNPQTGEFTAQMETFSS